MLYKFNLTIIILILGIIISSSLFITLCFYVYKCNKLEKYKSDIEARAYYIKKQNIELEEQFKINLNNIITDYEKKIDTINNSHANELRLAKSSRRTMPKFSTNTGGIETIINYITCAEWSNQLINRVQELQTRADRLYDDCSELSYYATKQKYQLESLVKICDYKQSTKENGTILLK